MILCMMKSSNESIRMLAVLHKDVKTSIIGGNWSEISEYLNVNMNEINVKDQLLNKKYERFTPECQLVLELIDVTEGSMQVPGFSRDELSEMLNEICTL